MRKNRRLGAALALAACFGAPFIAWGAAQQPLYVIDLSSLTPAGGASFSNGSVTFLSDHTLVVGMCFKGICNLRAFDISSGSPRQIAQADGIDRYGGMLRSGDDGVLLTGVVRRRQRGAILLGESLHTSRWIPRIAGSSAYGEKIAEGQGRLLAHTTNLAAYWDQGTVRIQNVEGQMIGSFDVGENHIPWMSFLGQDRILFKDTEIRDFHGKVLRKLKKPARALGERTKQTAEGSRLLYDSFTRRVGLAQTIKEDALVIPTMGMSTDGDVPNGEVVRVTDTGSGKRCFEWYGKENLLPPFFDHADIDPSGRLIAIITSKTVPIFALPQTCATK